MQKLADVTKIPPEDIADFTSVVLGLIIDNED